MTKIYLDTCSLNREFDDQDFAKIALETEAVNSIKTGIYSGRYSLAWSFILDYEINNSPYDKRRDSVLKLKEVSQDFCMPIKIVLERGKEIECLGIGQNDSLHIASAIEMKCEYFITTDKQVFNKIIPGINTINPMDFVIEMEAKQ